MDKKAYIIVEVEWPDGIRSLQEKVNNKIREGYIPAGGVSTWNDKLRGRCMIQAMRLIN